MNKISIINLRILVIPFIFLTVGCIDRTQELTYELIDERSLLKESTMTPWPELIIIAKENEIILPAGLDFTNETYQLMRDINFDQFFAILLSIGRIKDSGTVKEIARKNHTVIIRINPHDPGPGEIVLPE